MSALGKELLALAPPEDGIETPIYDQLADRFSAPADIKALRALVAPWKEEVVNYDDPHAWLPVHAWRILAVGGDFGVIQPLLRVADHPDDYLAYGEFGAVAAKIGIAAVEPLAKVLSSSERSDLQRILAAQGLNAIARENVQAKAQVVSALEQQLEEAIAGEGDVSAASAEALMDLGATEAGETVRKAHAAGLVNLGVGAEDRLDEAFPRASEA